MLSILVIILFHFILLGDAHSAPKPSGVWYVAVGGDDGAAGGPATPFATIQHAIDVSSSGDTIRLYDGAFSGDGNRNLQLGARALTLASLSDDPAACVIDCGGLPGISFNDDTVALTDTVRIEGIRFTNATTAILLVIPWSGFGPPPPSRACVVRAVIVDDAVTGILTQLHDGRYEDLHFAVTGTGIRITSGNGTIRRARLTRAAEGLLLREDYYNYTDSLVIEDSDIVGNATGFWCISEGHVCRFVDSRVDSNSVTGILMSSGEYGRLELERASVSDNDGLGIDVRDFASLSATDCDIKRNRETGVRATNYTNVLTDVRIHGNGGWGVDSGHLWVDLTMDSCSVLGNGLGGCRMATEEFTINGSLMAGNQGPGLTMSDPSNRADSREVSETTIVANTGSGIVVDEYGGELTGLIIADNGGLGIDATATTDLIIACTDIHGNGGGDWDGDLLAYLGTDGNFSADPCFCHPGGGDYTLCATSPCLPDNHPHGADCGIIGGFGQGCTTPTDVPVPGIAAVGYRIVAACPNPFNPLTVIEYELPEPAMVSLRVFDPRGRLVQVLERAVPHGAGRHEATWTGTDDRGRAVATGVYLCRLEAGGYQDTIRLVLIR